MPGAQGLRHKRHDYAPRTALPERNDVHLATPLPLAAGVAVSVDPLTPDTWRSITVVHRTDGTKALLTDLVGPAEVGRVLRSEGSPKPITTSGPVTTGRAAEGWKRIALVDSLDRWLQVPVDSSLLQIERAVVRAQVAAALDDGPVRAGLLSDAVSLARQAQPGFEEKLTQLNADPPKAVQAAIRRLVHGVVHLADLRRDGEVLRSIGKAAEPALRARGRGRHTTPTFPTLKRPCDEPSFTGYDRAGLLDPRLVPARVVRFSDQPQRGEIQLHQTSVGDIPVLAVEVPAITPFSEGGDDTVVKDRLYARFVDTTTGRVHSRLLLTHGPAQDQAGDDGKAYAFSTRLPLDDDLDPNGLWVEVVDAEIDLPPSTGSSLHLVELRRKAVLLRQRRWLESLHRLGFVPEAQFAHLVRDLPGGPGNRRHDMVTGPGDLLVAELVHAYEASGPE